jgi:hypothetical protein
MSVPAWHLLPVEVLEHIITFVPRFLRPSLGDVCVQWAWALHSSALKYLTTSINLQRIEKSHLSRLGWSGDIEHDVSSCMCVDLAFRFFTTATVSEGPREIYSGEEERQHKVAVTPDKVFYKIDSAFMQWDVEAVSRMEEDREVIYAGNSGQFPDELNMDYYPKSLYIYENLLVMVLQKATIFTAFSRQNFKVCLLNGETKARFADLDFEACIREPEDSIYFRDVAVSKDMLAVLVNVRIGTRGDEVQRALLWRVNTSQPEALAPQFIGKVTFKGDPRGNDLLLMNDRFFCKYHREVRLQVQAEVLFIEKAVLFIEKAVLMNEDQTRVVRREQVANSNNLGNSWKSETGNNWKSETENSCFSDSDDEKDSDDSDEEESNDEYESYYEDEEDNENSFLQGSSRVSKMEKSSRKARWYTSKDAVILEPGSSSRLAIFNPWLQTLKILDLALSEPVIVHIYVGANLFLANWCGGNLLFLKDLRRGGEQQEGLYGVQVAIFDPALGPGLMLEEKKLKQAQQKERMLLQKKWDEKKLLRKEEQKKSEDLARKTRRQEKKEKDQMKEEQELTEKEETQRKELAAAAVFLGGIVKLRKKGRGKGKKEINLRKSHIDYAGIVFVTSENVYLSSFDLVDQQDGEKVKETA